VFRSLDLRLKVDGEKEKSKALGVSFIGFIG